MSFSRTATCTNGCLWQTSFPFSSLSSLSSAILIRRHFEAFLSFLFLRLFCLLFKEASSVDMLLLLSSGSTALPILVNVSKSWRNCDTPSEFIPSSEDCPTLTIKSLSSSSSSSSLLCCRKISVASLQGSRSSWEPDKLLSSLLLDICFRASLSLASNFAVCLFFNKLPKILRFLASCCCVRFCTLLDLGLKGTHCLRGLESLALSKSSLSDLSPLLSFFTPFKSKLCCPVVWWSSSLESLQFKTFRFIFVLFLGAKLSSESLDIRLEVLAVNSRLHVLLFFKTDNGTSSSSERLLSFSELSNAGFCLCPFFVFLALQIPESFLLLSTLTSLSTVDSEDSASSSSSSSSLMKSDKPLSSESSLSPRLTYEVRLNIQNKMRFLV